MSFNIDKDELKKIVDQKGNIGLIDATHRIRPESVEKIILNNEKILIELKSGTVFVSKIIGVGYGGKQCLTPT